MLDEKGKELLRNGIIDADIALFPERYRKYLIPAALLTYMATLSRHIYLWRMRS